ncbi:MAG: septal ring lytic transglycosylase RlpA family protein [Solirubrobacteraceae bacterium]
MIRAHAGLKLWLLLATGAAVLAAPQIGWANSLSEPSNGSGGVGFSGPGGSGGPGSGSGGTGDVVLTAPANLPVSATGDGITVATTESALNHQMVQFTGSAPPADAGDIIEIERMEPQIKSSWISTAQTLVAAGGSFTVAWRANQSGMFSIRAALIPATVEGTLASEGSGASSALPAATATSAALAMTVYRPTVATWYGGPTMFGNQTACHELLRRNTLGVANLTLPCGTPVGIYYAGRSIVVPVIDRGPYVKGVTWDLTEATAKAIGMLTIGRATIGTVALAQS